MLRVSEILHDQRMVSLLPESARLIDKNSYTVVVGKNGVGKSRLLASIAKSKITRDYYRMIDFDGVGYRNYYEYPPMVIAVSTSPFDKFPNHRSKSSSELSNYRYVGMRGEGPYSASSAVSLISSASRGLLNKLLKQNNNANFLEVFEALSFSPFVGFVFKPAFFKYSSDDAFAPPSPNYARISTAEELDAIFLDERYLNAYQRLDMEDQSNAVNAMSNLASHFDQRKALVLEVDFSTNEIYLSGSRTHPHIVHSIQILMDVGLVRLMDLRLHKEDYGQLNLKRASSGEQCLMVMMLGIAGHIEDGSLILIDEPEISLHPRWQEEFMRLLTSAFSGYRYCHFIVATHSPQIVARMDNCESYIYSLSKDRLYSSKDFNNKSADFQLAELFDAPGLMNEYISRVSFNLMAKLRARKTIDSETTNELNKLLELREKLSVGDPTIALINSVYELYQHYASN